MIAPAARGNDQPGAIDNDMAASDHHHAAIDVQGLAGHVAGLGAGQIDGSGRDVAGLAERSARGWRP